MIARRFAATNGKGKTLFKRLPEPGEDDLTVFVDGVPVQARAGDCAASVLLRTQPYFAGQNAVSQRSRAPFCMMGVCMDCAAIVDGKPSTLTCQTPVAEGMSIERQSGLPRIGTGEPDV